VQAKGGGDMSSIIDPAWLAKYGYKLTPQYQRRIFLLSQPLLSRRELIELGADEGAVRELTNPNKVKRSGTKLDTHLFLTTRDEVQDLLRGVRD
jgi:hypothetical protein